MLRKEIHREISFADAGHKAKAVIVPENVIFFHQICSKSCLRAAIPMYNANCCVIPILNCVQINLGEIWYNNFRP